MKVLIITSLIGFTTCFSLWGQSPKFQSPVDVPISLAGNFGELRGGHFHAGLDIRTQGREGLAIKAAAPGYISRIGISLYGYGKVLYLTHPNGYTTVYAHLQKFNPEIEKYIKDIQYRDRKFTLDIQVDSSLFTYQAGDVIGVSGNRGGSGGPHLHFEIRNTGTERPLNPYLYGFKVADHKSPVIKTFSIYPLNDQSEVNGRNEALHLPVTGGGGKYRLKVPTSLKLHGKIGFGVETEDFTDSSPFRNGVYSIELLKNGHRVYFHQMDSFSFDETRYIQAHMDFYQAKKYKKRIQRSYLLDGNELSIYQDLVNRGKLFFITDTSYSITYKIKDFFGNTSQIEVDVNSLAQKQTAPQVLEASTHQLILGQSGDYSDDHVHLHWDEHAVYENTPLRISEKKAIGRCQTPRYGINTLYDPLHEYVELSIRIDSIPERLHSKLIVVSLDKNSKILAAEGGEIEGDFIKVKTRSFGPYTVMADTTAPVANFTGFKSGKRFQSPGKIRFSVKDDISGLHHYEAYIDDQWTLVEYERNKKSGFLEIDRVQATGGRHDFTIELTDWRGNQKVLKGHFIY
ncbi:M23 family metallopeptidase [bacterium SCSIO 12741]|nr:M23 family metallopeptidase [bacterium SCSIO 12741]